MGNNCCLKKKLRRKIVLLLVGLDNAGKTKAASTLTGDRLNSPVPTIGFSVFNLEYGNYNVKVFDLGGGPNIRGIWNKYFVDAHGIVFVVDSSDYSRFDEVKLVLEDLLHSDKISGKPLLILANKQDNENALDEIDLIEYLNIEELVNSCQCSTLVQSCCASEKSGNQLDPGIQKGYHWLMNNIIKSYDTLNTRVEYDVKEQEIKEREEILEKIQRIKNTHKIEDRNKKDDDAIESYSDYARKLNGNVQDTENLPGTMIVDDKDNVSDHSRESPLTFPAVCHTNINNGALLERPKSAVQIVKHQLQLNNTVRKVPLRPRLNKTAPVNMYGVKLPHSASERRRDFSRETRNLKSADDRLFTITNKVPGSVACMGPSGDSCHINALSSFERTNKLPPLEVGRNRVPWVHKTIYGDDNPISIVDVE